jgi:hypothetical protein
MLTKGGVVELPVDHDVGVEFALELLVVDDDHKVGIEVSVEFDYGVGVTRCPFRASVSCTGRVWAWWW